MARRTWEGLTSKAYATAGNWKEGSAPSAGDEVWLTGTQALDGSDQSATELDDFLDELNAEVGNDQAYLQIGTSKAVFNYASGIQYIDLDDSDIDVLVRRTQATEWSLYLLGSDLNTVTNINGYVSVAGLVNDTSTVVNFRQDGDGRARLGSGTTLTTVYQRSGRVLMECAGTTVTVHGGTFETRGSGAITTINQYGGNVKLNSTGTVTAYNHYGGKLNATGDSIEKTITTYTAYTNSGPTLELDPSIVTVTNFTKPTTKFRVQWVAA